MMPVKGASNIQVNKSLRSSSDCLKLACTTDAAMWVGGWDLRLGHVKPIFIKFRQLWFKRATAPKRYGTDRGRYLIRSVNALVNSWYRVDQPLFTLLVFRWWLPSSLSAILPVQPPGGSTTPGQILYLSGVPKSWYIQMVWTAWFKARNLERMGQRRVIALCL